MARVTMYHNVTQVRRGMTLAPAIFGRMPWGYQEGDTLAIGFAYTDPVAADQLGACNRAFEIGNVDADMCRDDVIRDLVVEYREERIRSLSTGDVVTVDGHAYAVASVGFDDLGPAAGLNFAGGRTAREVRDLIDDYESQVDTKLSAADRAFVEGLIVPADPAA